MESVRNHILLFGILLLWHIWSRDKLMNGESECFVAELLLICFTDNIKVRIKPDFVRILSLLLHLVNLAAIHI